MGVRVNISITPCGQNVTGRWLCVAQCFFQKFSPSPTRESVDSCCQLVPANGAHAACFVQNHHGHQDEQFPPSDLGGDISLLFGPVAFPQPERETLPKSSPKKPRTASQYRDRSQKRIFHVDFIQLLPRTCWNIFFLRKRNYDDNIRLMIEQKLEPQASHKACEPGITDNLSGGR